MSHRHKSGEGSVIPEGEADSFFGYDIVIENMNRGSVRMNKRQTILLVIIILAVALYCWILFFEIPDKTASIMNSNSVHIQG